MPCRRALWCILLLLVSRAVSLGPHTSDYGQSLPQFAYDFSEYITSALIERAAETNELYLTMLLVGHDVVFNDYPFETISTEESVLYNWGQASKIWDRNKNRTALTRHSGLACLLKNNDPKHSQSYRVPALWVPTSEAPDTRLHGSLEMLRCRLKGTTTIYNTLSKMPTAALFVDLIRIVPLKSDPSATRVGAGGKRAASRAAQVTSRRLMMATKSTQPQRIGNPNHTRYDVLVSFSVPWHSRLAGYGLGSAVHANTSRHDPWLGSEKHAFYVRNRTAQATSQVVATAQVVSYLGPAGMPRVHVCSAGLRPLHPVRPKVGLPLLLEFVEHHVSLGVDHVFLGLLLSPRSPHWASHAHLLRDYVDRRQVSLSSLALEGFDDGGGFGGVHLQDEYVTMLFHNQCLYYSKGVADFVILLKPTEFLAPSAALLQQMQVQSGVVANAPTSTTLAALLKTLPQTYPRAQAGVTATCYFKVEGAYGVPDPPENFGMLAGPADTAFSVDFFKTSRAVGALNNSAWHTPVLPTRLVMATTSRDAAVCVFRQSSDWKKGTLLVRAQAVNIASSALLTFIYGANLKKGDYMSVRSSREDPQLDFSAAARKVSETAKQRLAARGYPDVASLSAAAAKGRALHIARAEESEAAAALLSEEERARMPLKEVPMAKTAFVAPFWLRCDVASLHQVLSKVFTK